MSDYIPKLANLKTVKKFSYNTLENVSEKNKVVSLTITASYISIENDSGIESLDSLSPKDLDNTPLNSPEINGCQPEVGGAVPQPAALPPGKEPSILTSLLSAPPSKEPSSISQSMLSTLLTCTTRSEKTVNEVAKINVVAINPENMSLVNQVMFFFLIT